MVEAVRRVSGAAFPVREGPRRPGDPPDDDLETIVRTAWNWERRLAERTAAAGTAAPE